MLIHDRVQFYLSIKREQSSSTGSSKVLTNHLNMGGMLTLVIRITDLVDFTYMSFIVLGAAAWISALQHLLSSSMDSGDDPTHAHGIQTLSTSRISLVSFMTTRSVRALEDHVAWSSRTSLVTIMSVALASSSCSTNTWLQSLFFVPCFLFSSFCCSSVSAFSPALTENISY